MDIDRETMALTPDQIRLGKIFHPYMFEKLDAVASNGTRFVHYTSADAAMNILRTKEVRMRKTSCMNDFMEVQYGRERLVAAYHSEVGKNLQAVLNNIFPGSSKEIEKLIDSWFSTFFIDSYLVCFSEHIDNEDLFGRLSMWRAYGSTTGVALVLNNTPFLRTSEALKAYSSPVGYFTSEDFQNELEKIVVGLEKNAEFVHAKGRESVITYTFNAFRFAILCTKHPGFQEEKEWRVVYIPKIDKSNHLINEIKIIDGVPQPIYKIPLRNIPEEGLTGVEIPELIERIIIGPTQYPSAIREAFQDLLDEAGVKNAAKRIVVSDIPLRQ